MSDGNGRIKRTPEGGLILPPGLDSSAMEPEGMTVDQWIHARPNHSVTRLELDVFTDTLVRTKIAALLRYVVDKKAEQLHETMGRMILEREADLKAHRWYRRLGRWIATFGHKPAPVMTATKEELEAAMGALAELEATRPDRNGQVTGVQADAPPTDPDTDYPEAKP